MGRWFSIRFGCVSAVSIIVFYVFYYLVSMWFRIPQNQVLSYLWILICFTWGTGLIIIRFQHAHFKDPLNPENYDFRKLIAYQKKHGKGKGVSKNLGEMMEAAKDIPVSELPNERKTTLDEDYPQGVPIGLAGLEKSNPGHNKTGLSNVVEAAAKDALVDAEVDLTLTAEAGSELEIFGNKFKMEKGSTIHLTTRMKKEQKLSEMFPGKGKRTLRLQIQQPEIPQKAEEKGDP